MVLQSDTTLIIPFTWFYNLSPLKVYFLQGFTVWQYLKYTFYKVSKSDTTDSYFLIGSTVWHHLKYTFDFVLQSDTTQNLLLTWFYSLPPLKVYSLHGLTLSGPGEHKVPPHLNHNIF